MSEWSKEMAHAYGVGLEDGRVGKRRGRPNDFEACYEQGWQHGLAERYAEQSRAYDLARGGMQAALNEA